MSATNSNEKSEKSFEIPVWVQGKRKWVTGITKKTTFDDLIYALLVQANILKTSEGINIDGYGIAESLQISMPAGNVDHDVSLLTQRILKGRTKVVKMLKNCQFDKFPQTVLHLISNSSFVEKNSPRKSSSKIVRRFFSSKNAPENGQSMKLVVNKLNEQIRENSSILERQKRLLEFLDEKIQFAEESSSKKSVSLSDVELFFGSKTNRTEDLIVATQLCNSILKIDERLEEKQELLSKIEENVSNELNQIVQQHYDVLPSCSSTTEFQTVKNSIDQTRELTRVQSKQMHDLDLSIRETESLLSKKYDQLSLVEQIFNDENNNLNEFHLFKSLLLKETDDDSGINSLTSDDSHFLLQQTKNNAQLETLVWTKFLFLFLL